MAFRLALLLAAAALAPGTALACSDAGPPPLTCSDEDAGAGWRSCDDHGDCPSGAVCAEVGVCFCGPCAHGDRCVGGACRCAPPEEPEVPPGCRLETGGCLGTSYDVVCDGDAGVEPGPAPEPTGSGCRAAPSGGRASGGLAATLLALALLFRRRG